MLNKGYGPITAISLISLIACWFMCVTILTFRQLRSKTEMKYVFVLELFYGVQCFVTILPGSLNEDLCTFQGFSIRFTGLCGVLWTGYICFSFYWVDALRKRLENLMFALPLIIIILFSLFTAILSLTYPTNNYGSSESWCWNKLKEGKNEEVDDPYKYALFYAIVWFVMIAQVIMLIHLSRIHRRNGAREEKTKHLKYYPIVLIFCFMPISIFRILQSAIDPKKIPQEYQIFSACILRLLGLLNCIIYGLELETRNIVLGKSTHVFSDSISQI